jgi:hypothetical protein
MSIKIGISSRVEVKVEIPKHSIACRMKGLGIHCDYGDKGNVLSDGTPICLGRMEECPNFCILPDTVTLKGK